MHAREIPTQCLVLEAPNSALRCRRRGFNRGRRRHPYDDDPVLHLLNLVQLVLYIALLSFAGRALLWPFIRLAGSGNIFHQVLCLLGRPFTSVVRRLLPAAVPDQAALWLTFFFLLVLYGVVTFERADLCITAGQLGLAGCR